VDGEFIECDIGIKGGRISRVSKNMENGEVEIDASNCFVFPGFFNSHTHAAMTLFRGLAEGLPLRNWLERIWEAEAKLDPEDVYWGAMLACLEMLKTGTTCFADMYIHMDEVAKAVGESGIRAVLGYGMADRGSEERAKSELDIGLKFAKEWNGGFEGRIRCMLTPHAPYTCSPEFLRIVAQQSQKYNLIKHIHVAETAWEVEEIQKMYGKKPVQLLDSIGFLDGRTVIAHGVWLGEEEIDILSKRRVSVVHCPTSNLKLSSGIAYIPEMLEKDVNVCIGTDGAASNNMLNMFSEIRLAALLQLLRGRTVNGRELIKMASERGYVAYGIEGGKLEKGYLADIVITEKTLRHHPLYSPVDSILYASTGCEVRHVLVNGEIVVEDGILLTFDEDQVIRKVESRIEKFL
jgi:5-methylthioadenosine/S-adenosylhomocysteine deaminase